MSIINISIIYLMHFLDDLSLKMFDKDKAGNS